MTLPFVVGGAPLGAERDFSLAVSARIAQPQPPAQFKPTLGSTRRLGADLEEPLRVSLRDKGHSGPTKSAERSITDCERRVEAVAPGTWEALAWKGEAEGRSAGTSALDLASAA